MVSGTKRNLYEKCVSILDKIFASIVDTTTPERLSLHKEGWQT